MAERHHGPVEVVPEAVVPSPAIVAHEPVRRLFALDHKARQDRQPGPEGVAPVFGELLLERAGPRRHRAFPAHAVEMRQRLARQRPGVRNDRPAHAVEVTLHRLGIQHVDVVLVAFDRGMAEAHQRPLSLRHVPDQTAPGVHLRRQFDDLLGDARLDRRLSVEALARRSAHRIHAVAGVHPVPGPRDRRAAVLDGEGRDAPEVLPVGVRERHVEMRAGRQGRGLADESLGRVRTHFPRPLQRPRATAEIDADLQPDPRRLPDAERQQLAPLGAHELHVGFGQHDVPLVVPIAARVEHQQSAEAHAPHGLHVAGDGFLVHMPVDPPPVRPRPVRHRYIAKILLQRRRRRAPDRTGQQTPQHESSKAHVVIPFPPTSAFHLRIHIAAQESLRRGPHTASSRRCGFA